MKRVLNLLLIALCFLSPLFASITLAQQPPQPAIESAPTAPTEPTIKPTSGEVTSPQSTPAATSSTGDTTAQKQEQAPTPAEVARLKRLTEADQLYMGGQYAAAQKIYREVKSPFAVADQTERKPPITDPQKLSPGGQVYWREAQAGLQQKLETATFVPLQLLVQQDPEFIPGQLAYVQALKDHDRPKEALTVLRQAAILYPDQPDLVRANVEAQAQEQQWLEASLTARQFTLTNPDDPAVPEFRGLADKYLARYQQHIRAKVRGNAIGSLITGGLGFALTGNIFGPLSAVSTTVMLMRGESAIGAHYADQAKRQLPMVKDETVLNYVQEVGNRLATVAGRNDFKYEFYVVKDDKLNAFALPGGKVFVNAGAIVNTKSEAELAGLMGHELSHAVLSHGFQMMAEGSLTDNILQYLPYGGVVSDLVVLHYSRDKERQADIVGTRVASTTGYAADGLRNLMVTLKNQDKSQPLFPWMATHPVTAERISYLEDLIQRSGYNRYAYEGVARHAQVKEQVKKLLAENVKKKRDRNGSQAPF